MNRRILLSNITLNDEVTHILIEGNRFKSLHAAADTPADVVMDCKNKAILPAFYNCHTHAAMMLMRGYADDMPLFPWLNDYIWPYEAHVEKEDIYAGSRLAILEMIKSGTVFFNDMYWNIEETIRAVEEMGIRASLGVTFMDRLSEEAKDLDRRIIKDWKGTPSGRVQLAVAPHAIYTAGETLLRECDELSATYHLPFHTHLSETEQEVKDCVKEHGMTPVRWLDSLGLLSERSVLAHAVWVDDEEMAIIAKRGATIVHNPCSNMKLSSGVFRYEAALKSGCRIALGTDGASSNNNLDLHEEMKVASLVAKLECTPQTLPVKDIMSWATRNGAETFGIDAGAIEEGKLADCVIINLDDERMVPCHHLMSNWVYSANNTCIDAVMCNGSFVMEGGKVPHEQEIIEEARAACRRVSARLGK